MPQQQPRWAELLQDVTMTFLHSGDSQVLPSPQHNALWDNMECFQPPTSSFINHIFCLLALSKLYIFLQEFLKNYYLCMFKKAEKTKILNWPSVQSCDSVCVQYIDIRNVHSYVALEHLNYIFINFYLYLSLTFHQQYFQLKALFSSTSLLFFWFGKFLSDHKYLEKKLFVIFENQTKTNLISTIT